MINRVKQRIHEFLNSRYLLPSTAFFFFLILASVAVFFLELGRGQGKDFFDAIWWAVITSTTTGYGDIVTNTTVGRIVSVITIFIGVGAMSFLSGALASVFVDRNTRARRGLLEFPKLKDHFVICGWKNHMQDILLDILDVAKDMTSERIVLISNIEAETVNQLKEVGELRSLKFVKGDYFSELALNRANVREARKVIILADTFESGAISEVDSKTVMTVMTVKSMAKDVYTYAELLDRKFENYLKQAMCDEILYARDFSRRMLASTTATNGLSNIIFELLSAGETKSKLATYGISHEFIGKKYSVYKSALQAFPKANLFGLLENTGSPNKIKLDALREAQKTPDISQLVINLQQVKGLEVNRPVFLPEDDYIIKKNSMAIVLEKE